MQSAQVVDPWTLRPHPRPCIQTPLSDTNVNTTTVLSHTLALNARTSPSKFQTGPWHVPHPISPLSFHIIAYSECEWARTNADTRYCPPCDHIFELATRYTPAHLSRLLCTSTYRVVANVARVGTSGSFVVVDLCNTSTRAHTRQLLATAQLARSKSLRNIYTVKL